MSGNLHNSLNLFVSECVGLLWWRARLLSSQVHDHLGCSCDECEQQARTEVTEKKTQRHSRFWRVQFHPIGAETSVQRQYHWHQQTPSVGFSKLPVDVNGRLSSMWSCGELGTHPTQPQPVTGISSSGRWMIIFHFLLTCTNLYVLNEYCLCLFFCNNLKYVPQSAGLWTDQFNVPLFFNLPPISLSYKSGAIGHYSTGTDTMADECTSTATDCHVTNFISDSNSLPTYQAHFCFGQIEKTRIKSSISLKDLFWSKAVGFADSQRDEPSAITID